MKTNETNLKNGLRRPAVALAFWVLLTAGGMNALAQSDSNLDVKLIAHRVAKDANGKESLLPGDKAKPGDVLQYTATYSNKTTRALRQLAPTVPIPAGAQYVSKSARPAPMYASLDGVEFKRIPITTILTTLDGSKVKAQVPPSQYKALRWAPTNLGPKQAVTVKLRTKIDPAPTAGGGAPATKGAGAKQ